MKSTCPIYGLAFLAIATGLSIPVQPVQPTWSYWECKTGVVCPSSWSDVAQECGGSQQSPIDISPYYTTKAIPKKFLSVESDNDMGLVEGVFANIGHTVQFTVDEKKGSVFLAGGPADSVMYKLSHIQFHFGCEDNKGSEHTFDTNAAAAEMQMLFYSTKYKSFKDAANATDGLLAVSSLFTAYGGQTFYVNPTLERFVALLPNLTNPGSYVELDKSSRIELTKLVPGLTRQYPNYYTYKGSLTTPPCYESVTWIILKERLTISQNHLSQFRKLQNQHGFSQCDNFRPAQPLNNRQITRDFDEQPVQALYRKSSLHT